jgi:DNA-binding CsgD family transcriptional regulator
MLLIVQGRTSKEIARLLGVSVPTVRKHRENLLRRLGCRNTAQLIARASGAQQRPGAPAAGEGSEVNDT